MMAGHRTNVMMEWGLRVSALSLDLWRGTEGLLSSFSVPESPPLEIENRSVGEGFFLVDVRTVLESDNPGAAGPMARHLGGL